MASSSGSFRRWGPSAQVSVTVSAAVAALLAGCDQPTGPADGGGRARDGALTAADSATTDSGPAPSCLPPGTYGGVSGGISARACGRTLTRFQDGAATVTEADAGRVRLTVSGTTDLGDVTDCEGTVTEGAATGLTEVTASCVHPDGSSVRYQLTFTCSGFYGRASATTAGGGCTVPWDVRGSRLGP